MNRIMDDELLEFMGYQEESYLVSPLEIHDRIIAENNGTGGVAGQPLPWNKTIGRFELRPKELTIWAGINSHGKSAVMGQVMAHLCKTSKVVIASLEMPIEKTIHRIGKQLAGTGQPTDDWLLKLHQWFDKRLWVYDQLDTIEADRILALVYLSAKKLGCKHIVIDSLVKCGLKGSDGQLSANQREFVDRLCLAARQTGIHIHLVHHMRKGSTEDIRPTKFDVKGAGEIVDLADNLVIVYRNKAKERKEQSGAEFDIEQPDTQLIIAKQRHFTWEGVFNLWFHRDSGAYTPNFDRRPLPFFFETQNYEQA